jgi:lipoprotein-anchoring transpeptidase ErfK/SrfK
MNDRFSMMKLNSSLSRREFIKFCSLGVAAFFLPTNLLPRLDATGAARRKNRLFGRVQQNRYPLYETLSVESDVIHELSKDSIYEITGISICEDDTSANRTWYELDGKGYAHSRRIQPVRMQINSPASIIPETGRLGEITIPFVNAYSSINEDRSVLYRLYYASTFWVTDRLTDENGGAWYQLLNDRFNTNLYVPAYYVRLVPDKELRPLSPRIPFEDKALVVDLQKQSLVAYEGEKVVNVFRISSGARSEEGGFATPKGVFRTTSKRPCRHMYAPPSEFGTGFDLPGVPWISYFTGDGVGFHGTYWHNDFGVPHSHGCINMSPQAAKWVYRWTTPVVPPGEYFYSGHESTRVVVQ